MESVHPLKTYRNKARLTQLALSEQLGVARTTVARWETGVRKIDRDLLSSVSDKTGVSKRDLRPDLAELVDEVGQ